MKSSDQHKIRCLLTDHLLELCTIIAQVFQGKQNMEKCHCANSCWRRTNNQSKKSDDNQISIGSPNLFGPLSLVFMGKFIMNRNSSMRIDM
jgi:hypothetical protein